MTPEQKRVAMLFLAVLGRPVESDATLTSMALLGAGDLLRTLLHSPEFHTEVCSRLIRDVQVPQDLLDAASVAQVTLWASREEPVLFAGYRRSLVNIYSVLDALLGFEGSRSGLDLSEGDLRALLARLEERRLGLHQFVGAVEDIDRRSCRGYLLDAGDPDRDLFVRFKVNGLTQAVVPALDYRRDMQDGYGGSGRCGFSISFSDLIGSDEVDEAAIAIEEASSGFVLFRSEAFVFSRHRAVELRAEMKASLRAFRSEVDELIRRLSVGEGHAASTVGDYAAMIPFRVAAPKPELVEPVSALVEVPRGAGSEALGATLEGLIAQGADLGRIIVFIQGDAGEADRLSYLLNRHAARLSVVSGRDGPDALRGAIERCGTARVALLTAGEHLGQGGLAWLDLGLTGGSRLAYADSESAPSDAEVTPVFRAGFDADLLLTCDEYDTPSCVSAQDVAELDLARAIEAGDLRFAAVMQIYEASGAGAFRHVPVVVSRSSPEPFDDERRTERLAIVGDHLRRTAPGASLEPHEDRIAPAVRGRSMVVWPAPEEKAVISIVVPTKDAMDMVLSLVASLKSDTAILSRLRIFVVSNNSTAPQTAALMGELAKDTLVRVVEDDGPFNWSRLNDTVIRREIAEGIVLCLNNDMICQTPGWDQRLRAQLARAEVGVVGARLLYPTGALQHAGITMNGSWAHEGVGDFPRAGLHRDRTRVVHDAYAVTGAFMAFRRDDYVALGGFDVENLPVAFNDVDFCLKCRRSGLRVIYDPEQVWVHFESVSRGFDQFQPMKERRNAQAIALVRERFGAFADLDLTYNPHFTRLVRPYTQVHWPSRDEIEGWLLRQSAG